MAKSYFYQVPDELMCRTDLTATDKLLYAVIKRLKVCFASNKRLAEIIGCDEKTIRRSLDHLKRAGLIRQLPNQGHRTCYEVVGQNAQVKSGKMPALVGQNAQVKSGKMPCVNRDLIKEDNKRESESKTRTRSEDDPLLSRVMKFQSSWGFPLSSAATILAQLRHLLSDAKIENYLDFVEHDPRASEYIQDYIGWADRHGRSASFLLADRVADIRDIANA